MPRLARISPGYHREQLNSASERLSNRSSIILLTTSSLKRQEFKHFPICSLNLRQALLRHHKAFPTNHGEKITPER